jgi:hypothetical protein
VKKVMADSYTLKSEILSLTFEENPSKNSPPLGFESQRLAGGDEGEGEKWLSCPPPPSPIKGEGDIRKDGGQCPPYIF